MQNDIRTSTASILQRCLNYSLETEEERELERIPLTTDSSRLESCVASLREVLGPLVSEETLIQVAIAADCNIDRALNHFFNTN